MGVTEKDVATVRRILNGSIGDFRDIVAKYKGLVFHVVRSILTEANDHEDVAQDIFIKVYEHLHRFEFRSSLATWISRIAYNSCLNHLRRTKKHPGNSLEYQVEENYSDEIKLTHGINTLLTDSQTPHTVICQKEIKVAVREAINNLPMKYRLMVTLHYLEGFSIPDLAETLNTPSGTIKSHLFRARALLKNSLLQKYSIEDLI